MLLGIWGQIASSIHSYKQHTQKRMPTWCFNLGRKDTCTLNQDLSELRS